MAPFRPVIIQPEKIDHQIAGRISPGDTVVIAGGDGTVSLVVGALFRLGLAKHVTFALLPLGTGNDLARHLGLGLALPADPQNFLEDAIANAACREIAVWQIGQNHFINYVGLGLDAQILKIVAHWRQRLPAQTFLTKALFGMAGLFYLGYRIRREICVSTDAGVFELKGQAGLILSSIGFYAGGSRVGPAEMNEPQLSVTLLRSGFDLGKIFFARFLKPGPALDYTLTKEAHIEGENVMAQIDGEFVPYRSCHIACAGKIKFLKL